MVTLLNKFKYAVNESKRCILRVHSFGAILAILIPV